MDMEITKRNNGKIKQRFIVLDADHPGFQDPVYVRRRNQIAQATQQYKGTIESIPVIRYTKQEHAVWEFVFSKLERLNKKFAYRKHREGMDVLKLDRKRIPQIKALSKRLAKTTGFRMVPVEGLVHPRIFMESLADGVFLSTQYIRHHSKPGFTPEPDIIHEVIGHAPQLNDPVIATITREIGEGAKRADDKKLKELERLYWFTIEYGVCRENGKLKAYGAGNLSSFIDLERCVSKQVKHLPFDVKRVVNTPYDPTKQAIVLFVVKSFDDALREIRSFVKKI
ncbi:phenylalanine 4-monooxygenase [Candidatus Woesearchaeota archaeon]|nr:phenylalanine 4-monooxygenase [Candidatus Woesearchaeota archaeon]